MATWKASVLPSVCLEYTCGWGLGREGGGYLINRRRVGARHLAPDALRRVKPREIPSMIIYISLFQFRPPQKQLMGEVEWISLSQALNTELVPVVGSNGDLDWDYRERLPLWPPRFVIVLLRRVGVGVVFLVAELTNLLQRPLVAVGPFRCPHLASEHDAAGKLCTLCTSVSERAVALASASAFCW